MQHIQPGPGLGMPGMAGGMHVGPGDPLYAGRMRVPPGGGGRGGGGPLPGMRFDPIGPRGMPVSEQTGKILSVQRWQVPGCSCCSAPYWKAALPMLGVVSC